MHAVYTFAIVILALLLAPWFAYQAIRYRKYIGNLAQRMGYLPVSFNLDGDESIWIHAVSVGEALTARALIAELRERYPGLKIFLSTTTLTGQQVARTRLQHLDAVFFFPFDLPPFVNRTLRLVKPRLFIMMETEIWPNLLRACRKAGVKTVLVNGRISTRSYPRYKLARGFFRRVLADVDRFCMQSDESARRIVDIGAAPDRVSVTGSLKFDSLEAPAVAAGRGAGRVLRYFRIPPARPVFIAASTLKGEEAPVLAAFAATRRVHPNALLIIAPRKPERFGEAETARARRRLSRRPAQRSADRRRAAARTWSSSTPSASWRTCSRSRRWCSSAAASSIRAGTTSSSRPCTASRLWSGRTWRTSPRLRRRSCANQAAVQVEDAAGLVDAIVRLTGDPVERARLGAAARALVEANRGAKTRTMTVIESLIPPPGSRGVVRPFRR